MREKSIPLVYSCSGCSSVAQLANDTALELNSDKIAQMSCIAGVGGNVKPLVKLAQSGRPVIAIDGCDLKCVYHSLDAVGVTPDFHYILTDEGFKKKRFTGSEKENVKSLCQYIAKDLELKSSS